jgi:hypothetical protein
MERCALEGFEHIRAEVEGQELREAEGDGDVMLKSVEQGPAVFAFHLLGVNREPSNLECFKVSVQRSGVAFELLSEVSSRLPPPGSNQGLDDLPLPRQLISPWHIAPAPE